MRRRRFEELDHQETPIGAVSLRRRIDPRTDEDVFEVKLDDDFLMSSMFTTSETELAHAALAHAPDRPLDVVVGGLGLGYTAAAVLDDERVRELVVVDALAPVIGWHRDGLVPLGPRLTGDPRCRLVHRDFFGLVLGTDDADDPDAAALFDVVAVDIDHSPRHLLHERHAPFYTDEGIGRVVARLRPGGVFALWSDDAPDDEYLARLRRAMPDARAQVVTFPDATRTGEATSTVYVASVPQP
ncbi:spermidine synthase [Cellulomonas dongxiuzhuiae]|uniref:Spermidine synthase n=1 Tax=Cellulomonas dongxiuzhuiae TaxID=2819979 RepID=A0ABX8GG42_9CELL|nr:spermidine synthase [Cellulomonas dongxiuzhuiae]MBO3094035.1 spermidine synthase [Cellulomonas dongxiuzhuiae]QWC15104.1 spermidine synthase [Cellulomonas dongxiuzhuiae]